jgi:hypothetical protein
MERPHTSQFVRGRADPLRLIQNVPPRRGRRDDRLQIPRPPDPRAMIRPGAARLLVLTSVRLIDPQCRGPGRA